MLRVLMQVLDGVSGAFAGNLDRVQNLGSVITAVVLGETHAVHRLRLVSDGGLDHWSSETRHWRCKVVDAIDEVAFR